ncbi:hypothetical protein CPLU01_04927 [Colletotrichum plurivorum]|uniref:Uncharacterized protein n=1 Tax=Colletotrichum plurivorum TaxID=2175906 RepID=A0A8H6KMZ8_9PEZI|nr:hypothetical protein CPLU01_04927 [Colletotrichum plurivorum]
MEIELLPLPYSLSKAPPLVPRLPRPHPLVPKPEIEMTNDSSRNLATSNEQQDVKMNYKVDPGPILGGVLIPDQIDKISISSRVPWGGLWLLPALGYEVENSSAALDKWLMKGKSLALSGLHKPM